MEEYVSFEIAKKLKEKGFDYPCIGHYVNNQLYIAHYQNAFHSDNYESLDAPTISQVLKWLRYEKRLYLGINYVPQIMQYSDYYFPTIQYIGELKSTVYTKFTDIFNTYEEAALAGIEYVLDNLI